MRSSVHRHVTHAEVPLTTQSSGSLCFLRGNYRVRAVCALLHGSIWQGSILNGGGVSLAVSFLSRQPPSMQENLLRTTNSYAKWATQPEAALLGKELLLHCFRVRWNPRDPRVARLPWPPRPPRPPRGNHLVREYVQHVACMAIKLSPGSVANIRQVKSSLRVSSPLRHVVRPEEPPSHVLRSKSETITSRTLRQCLASVARPARMAPQWMR